MRAGWPSTYPGQDGIRVLHALTFISILGGEGGRRESLEEAPSIIFNVLNASAALDVSPEQPVLTAPWGGEGCWASWDAHPSPSG